MNGLQSTSGKIMCILFRFTQVVSPIGVCERYAKACAIMSNGLDRHRLNAGCVGQRICGDVLSTTTLKRSTRESSQVR